MALQVWQPVRLVQFEQPTNRSEHFGQVVDEAFMTYPSSQVVQTVCEEQFPQPGMYIEQGSQDFPPNVWLSLHRQLAPSAVKFSTASQIRHTLDEVQLRQPFMEAEHLVQPEAAKT